MPESPSSAGESSRLSPGERALRALGDAVGDSRPRLPQDGSDPDIPVAATVVLVRQEAGESGVLLLERPDRGSFAGAWVFPGGKVDDEDRVGAVTEADAALAAAVRETREETGLVLDPEELVPLSVWDPPPGLPLRIRTWFFVAAAPHGALDLSPDEVVRASWETPHTALERHARGEMTLYPPTWVTLRGLASRAGDLLAPGRILERFETVARRDASGPILLWEGDAQYADPDGAGTARHRLELGRLPWVYRQEH